MSTQVAYFCDKISAPGFQLSEFSELCLTRLGVGGGGGGRPCMGGEFQWFLIGQKARAVWSGRLGACVCACGLVWTGVGWAGH